LFLRLSAARPAVAAAAAAVDGLPGGAGGVCSRRTCG